MDALAAFFFVIGATLGIVQTSCEDWGVQKNPVHWCEKNFKTKVQIKQCMIEMEK